MEHDHLHEHEGHVHGCGHCTEEHETGVKEWIPLILGAVLFAVSFFLSGTVRTVLLLASYVLVGYPVVISAVKNLISKHPFDEEVLMTIATIGALALGDFTEAVAVMLFYRVGEWLQDLAVEKSHSGISDAVSMHPDRARVMRDGVETDVKPEEVEIGEMILVKPGERIPLDGVVKEGETRLDCSSLTGESATILKQVGDTVEAGTLNTISTILIQTIASAEGSATGRLLHTIEEAAESKPKMEKFITRFSRVYTPCVILAAVLLCLIPTIFGGEFGVWAHRALTFLVISCPCALVLSIPLTFFAGLGITSKNSILLKGADVLERLSEVRVCVFDKTGTLTDGVFKVQTVHTDGRKEEEVLAYAAAVEKDSPHPVAEAIRKAAGDRKYEATDIRTEAGRGVTGKVNGQEVLVGNEALMRMYGADRTDFSGILVAVDGRCIGSIETGDSIRDNAPECVRELNSMIGYTALLTGDSVENAGIVCERLHMNECFASLLPEDKLRIMQDLRDRLGAVMFLGDGINDSPVLAGADVGIAMAENGTDMAAEAADALLLGDRLDKLGFLFRAAKKTVCVARENIILALVIKLAALVLSALGIVGMWAAVVADVGAALLCVLHALSVFRVK